jgi:glycosyltransferase involved in cell wall biosynthesis
MTAIEVLLVSLCLKERRKAILRAIESVVSQEGVTATPVIVVNGDRFDPNLFAELQQRTDVRILYQREASIFLARRLARENATAPFFAMLDDDDEILPGGLRTRLEALMAHDVDVVVSNGYLADDSEDRLTLHDIESIRRNPLSRLMERNWLATACGLFRSSSITPDYFDPTLRSNDMTYLAFRLGLERKILFIDSPTYRKRYSPDSISLTAAWNLPAAETLQKMLVFEMPPMIRHKLRCKLSSTLHVLSAHFMEQGAVRLAWRSHVQCLMQPSGVLRYGLFTRRLLAASIRRFIRWPNHSSDAASESIRIDHP